MSDQNSEPDDADVRTFLKNKKLGRRLAFSGIGTVLVAILIALVRPGIVDFVDKLPELDIVMLIMTSVLLVAMVAATIFVTVPPIRKMQRGQNPTLTAGETKAAFLTAMRFLVVIWAILFVVYVMVHVFKFLSYFTKKIGASIPVSVLAKAAL